MRKYVNIHNKEYYEYTVYCLFKLITSTNKIKYIKTISLSNLVYLHHIPTKIILRRINKESDKFSKVVQMRITFVSSYRFMSNIYYLKKKKPICEIKQNQILNRKRSLINSLNRSQIHPLI